MSGYLKLLSVKKYVPASVKRVIKNTLIKLRSFQTNRVLPDFIIIGVQKGGTTSLFTYLMQNEQIVPPLHKQTFYFDRHFEKPISYYKASFPKQSDLNLRSEKIGAPAITGEATPDYFYFPEVPKRIVDSNLAPKFIVIYRDPLQRSISEYNYLPQFYNCGDSIDNYFRKELDALKAIDFQNMTLPELMNHADNFPIMSRGFYNLQLKHWLQYFPKENFLFIKNKDLETQPLVELNKLAAFLNIQQFQSVDQTKYNQTKRKKDKPSKEIANEVIEVFEPHLLEFEELIK